MKRTRKIQSQYLRTIENHPPQEKEPRTFVGIDNGVSGGVTIIDENEYVLKHIKTPFKNCLNYTKKKAFINRVDFDVLKQALVEAGENTFVMIERPMINPGRFTASISAMRCMEATEIILEQLQIPYQFIDSKEWQQKMLPSGLKGDDLKKAANEVGKRLYPKLKIVNADCLLMALYCKRKMAK